jgi:NAD(P)H-dependent flavin oxidoreductase YrpB (nitropropane dioxygenase family)
LAKRVLRTVLCDLLGIEYPIIQAGMGGRSPEPYADPILTAAVSNAGGMGVLGMSARSPEYILNCIRKVKELTDKPFGADITPQEHKDFDKALCEKYGIPAPRYNWYEQCPPYSQSLFREQVQVILEEKVKVLACGLGFPLPEEIEQAHAQGTVVMSLAGNIKIVRRAAAAGVDIVIAEGHEGGGHTGRIGGLALLPQAVDATREENPKGMVVYAGGIADGRQIAAALMMGAVGVWLGTRFLASHEATTIMDWWKQAILDADDEGTYFSKRGDGFPIRELKPCGYTTDWDESPLPKLAIHQQRGFMFDAVVAAYENDLREACGKFGGQSAGLIKSIKSVQEIMDDLVEETVEGMRVMRESVTAE